VNLGLQLLLLAEPAAYGSCLLGPQVWGLVLLVPVEFPEVFFLSLDNEGESWDAVPPVTLAMHNWDNCTFR
jgi:hypothetical protein